MASTTERVGARSPRTALLKRMESQDSDETGSMCSSRSSATSADEIVDFLRGTVKGLRIYCEESGDYMSEEEVLRKVTESVSTAARHLAPVAILVMNGNSELMDMNPKAEELFGYSREECIGQSLRKFMPTEIGDKHSDYVKEYNEKYKEKGGAPRSQVVGKSKAREIIAQRRVNGAFEKFKAEIRVRGIPHPAGKALPPIFFIGYIEDITERTQLKEALEINQFIREKADSALIVMDDYGRIVDFNPRAATMFRYYREFIVGQNIKRLMPPQFAAIHDEMMRRHRERIETGMLHTSPVIGQIRKMTGYRPKIDEPGCEEFPLEIRVEGFSGGRVLVAFARDTTSTGNAEVFMESTTKDLFPAHTVDRLMRGEKVWDKLNDVTVLFSHVKGFSKDTSQMAPAEVYQFIHEMFSKFDEIGYEMEKIKTIGSGYMAYFTDVENALFTALNMLEWARSKGIELRVGLHSGEVVTGVVGKVRKTFDMWGDVVNTAKRMEEQGSNRQIQISVETFEMLPAMHRRYFIEAEAVVKSKGVFTTYMTDFVDGDIPADVLQAMNNYEQAQRQKKKFAEMRRARSMEHCE